MLKGCIKLHGQAFFKDKQDSITWMPDTRNFQLEHRPDFSEVIGMKRLPVNEQKVFGGGGAKSQLNLFTDVC